MKSECASSLVHPNRAASDTNSRIVKFFTWNYRGGRYETEGLPWGGASEKPRLTEWFLCLRRAFRAPASLDLGRLFGAQYIRCGSIVCGIRTPAHLPNHCLTPIPIPAYGTINGVDICSGATTCILSVTGIGLADLRSVIYARWSHGSARVKFSRQGVVNIPLTAGGSIFVASNFGPSIHRNPSL